ncbi:MAG: ribosome maturation factor RimM [Vicinamibacteraceae bacterium]
MADTDAAAPDDVVLVGTVERPHGLRGEVVVHPLTDFGDERFVPGATLQTARPGRTPDGTTVLRIDDVRWHKDRPLVLFEGVESLEAAEALRGLGLWIVASARPALEPGVFYETDLVGCRVETVSAAGVDAPGTAVGTVQRIDGAPGAAVLVVETANGEVLVPLADEICRVIDPATRRIVIDPPAGLLELNAPAATPRAAKRGKGRPPQ